MLFTPSISTILQFEWHTWTCIVFSILGLQSEKNYTFMPSLSLTGLLSKVVALDRSPKSAMSWLSLDVLKNKFLASHKLASDTLIISHPYTFSFHMRLAFNDIYRVAGSSERLIRKAFE